MSTSTETISPFGLLVGDRVTVALVGRPDLVVTAEVEEVNVRPSSWPHQAQVTVTLLTPDDYRFTRVYHKGEVVDIEPRKGKP